MSCRHANSNAASPIDRQIFAHRKSPNGLSIIFRQARGPIMLPSAAQGLDCRENVKSG